MPQPSITVIDDDPDFLDLLCIALGDAGYECIPHLGVEGAVDLIRAEQPVLVILDIHMRQANAGDYLLARLRADPRTATIPLLLCTGDTQYLAEHGEALREQGIGILPKPFEFAELLAEIEALIGPSVPPAG